ncbi:hypothetical protein F4805DRAFT_478410 [Annulohypoxylon moriforme]|nr:hypothetical protein F4805DRAFT_478410 [Annulohypoxylon moriforme]
MSRKFSQTYNQDFPNRPKDTKENEGLVEKFEKAYGEKRSAFKDHVSIVKEILDEAMVSGALRAIPITTRMKELDSAFGSLRRKQAARLEREELRRRMLEANGDWEGYWRKRGKDHMIEDYGPFKDVDSIMDALHDFGGVRVCVYFPQDVEKVVSWLQSCGKVEVKKVIRKTQGNKTMSNLRTYVETLQERLSSPEQNNPEGEIQPEVEDTGYRATHVIVELQGDAIPRYHKGAHYKVEIQIGTVVMHAWSQIEHDIIYKPDVTQPSDEQRDILEVFNGIVKSGEAALKQLAKTNDRKERDRARDKKAPATSHFELGVWINDYCKRYSQGPDRGDESPTWEGLRKLLDILRSGDEEDKIDDDTSGGLVVLLNHIRQKFLQSRPDCFGEDLPLFLLKAKYELEHGNIKRFSSAKFFDRTQVQAQEARHLAFRVVHSINMASFLGLADDFVLANEAAMPKSIERPSLVDFLDVLHPQKPRLDKESESRLIMFCQHFLNNGKLYNSIEDKGAQLRAEIPLLLTDIGRVVDPEGSFFHVDDAMLSDKGVLSVVPYSLATVLDDTDHASWIPLIFRSAESASSDTLVPDQVTTIDWQKTGEDLFPRDLRGLSQEVDPSQAPRLDALSFRAGLNHKDGTRVSSPTSPHSSSVSSFRLRKMQQGYFLPSSTRSSWLYVHQEPSKWVVNKIDLSSPMPEQTFEKYTRRNLWIEFANYLKPSYMTDIADIGDNGPEKYRFWVGNCEFTFHVSDGTLNCKLREDVTSKFIQRDAATDMNEAENGVVANSRPS